MKEPIDMNEAEMRSRFDFSRPTRGRFAGRYEEGSTVTLLDHDPDEEVLAAVPTKDSQLTEIAGKHLLISRLIAEGFEVAEPIRDKGIDLVVYTTSKDGLRFIAHPIQLKASSSESFSLDKKYEKLSGLLITYVWNVNGSRSNDIYVLTFNEALEVLNQKGFSKTDSWTKGGYYFVKKADARLKDLLKPFLVNSKRWRQLLQAS